LIAPYKQEAELSSGYHFLVNKDGKLFNAATFIVAKIIKAVMLSAVEIDYVVACMHECKRISRYTTNDENNIIIRGTQPPL
jgi:hypothetical protein